MSRIFIDRPIFAWVLAIVVMLGTMAATAAVVAEFVASDRGLGYLLLQYNGQTGQFSSNVRLALLNRSGTGLFVVYNDTQDYSDRESITLGRSLVVKFSRMFDVFR